MLAGCGHPRVCQQVMKGVTGNNMDTLDWLSMWMRISVFPHTKTLYRHCITDEMRPPSYFCLSQPMAILNFWSVSLYNSSQETFENYSYWCLKCTSEYSLWEEIYPSHAIIMLLPMWPWHPDGCVSATWWKKVLILLPVTEMWEPKSRLFLESDWMLFYCSCTDCATTKSHFLVP